MRAKCSILHNIAAYHEIKNRICDHEGVWREMAKSILEPPFDSLRAESNQVAQLAKGQPLLAEGRHMANTAPGVAGDILDGPECFGLNGFRVLDSRFLIFHTKAGVSNPRTAFHVLHLPLGASCCATMDRHDNA